MQLPALPLALFGFGLPEIVLILAVLVVPALFGFWVWMVIDVVRRERGPDGNQLAWILVVLLAGLFGAAIYCFVRKLPRDRAATRPPAFSA